LSASLSQRERERGGKPMKKAIGYHSIPSPSGRRMCTKDYGNKKDQDEGGSTKLI
jgi:hypothetical protein